MCARCESVANLAVLRLDAGSLLRSYSPPPSACMFSGDCSSSVTLHLLAPTLAAPSPSGCPRVPTLWQGGQAPAASAKGLSRPRVDPPDPSPHPRSTRPSPRAFVNERGAAAWAPPPILSYCPGIR